MNCPNCSGYGLIICPSCQGRDGGCARCKRVATLSVQPVEETRISLVRNVWAKVLSMLKDRFI